MKVADSPLLKQHVGKPAILDSNLLLLNCCFSFDPDLIGTFKRLNAFQIEDAELLSETLQVFSAIRTTPHVQTEVSNLASQLPYRLRDQWSEHFSTQIKLLSEEWEPAGALSESGFFRLGLTDTALAQLASTHLIVTTDFPLSNSLQSRGLNVVNFTHLRSMWLE